MVAIFLYMHGLFASSSILQTVASDPHIFFNFLKAYLLKETITCYPIEKGYLQ